VTGMWFLLRRMVLSINKYERHYITAILLYLKWRGFNHP